MEPERSDGLRRVLRGILAFGLLGTTADLLLIEHYEAILQLPAFGMLALSGAALVWHASSDSPAAARVFRGVMLLMLAAGVVGAGLHFRGNMEFQLEADPSLAGFALLEKVARSTAPPLLAPFNLTLLGLVGLASIYRGGRS